MFRAGEQGKFWYAVLGGQLEVRYHAATDDDGKVRKTDKIVSAETTKKNKLKNISRISFDSLALVRAKQKYENEILELEFSPFLCSNNQN